jgi:hypothetical protein
VTDEIILRERVITIKTGDTFDQALQGNVLRVTAGNVPLRVQSRDGQLDFSLNSGERAEFPSQNLGLILSHTSGADQTFTIQVGKGVNVASALVSGTVTITSGSVAVSNYPTAGAFSQSRDTVTNVSKAIIGARAARKYLLIQNNDQSSVVRLNLVGANATAVSGFRLQPGESLEISGICPSQAIYAMMETATSQSNNIEYVDF